MRLRPTRIFILKGGIDPGTQRRESDARGLWLASS
jgi:hypothetical protein